MNRLRPVREKVASRAPSLAARAGDTVQVTPTSRRRTNEPSSFWFRPSYGDRAFSFVHQVFAASRRSDAVLLGLRITASTPAAVIVLVPIVACELRNASVRFVTVKFPPRYSKRALK